jgi:hypothetical protein
MAASYYQAKCPEPEKRAHPFRESPKPHGYITAAKLNYTREGCPDHRDIKRCRPPEARHYRTTLRKPTPPWCFLKKLLAPLVGPPFGTTPVVVRPGGVTVVIRAARERRLGFFHHRELPRAYTLSSILFISTYTPTSSILFLSTPQQQELRTGAFGDGQLIAVRISFEWGKWPHMIVIGEFALRTRSPWV